MATVHANKVLTKFMLLLGGHNHFVKVSSDSETVRGMGLWEFSGALRELMLKRIGWHLCVLISLPLYFFINLSYSCSDKLNWPNTAIVAHPTSKHFFMIILGLNKHVFAI